MPVAQPAVTKADPVTDEKPRLTPLYRIIIHNDDVTPMDFVVSVLMSIFGLGLIRATKVMWEAHRTGAAHVLTEPLERAEFHVEQARSLSRGRGYPLTFTIEPEA